MAESCVMVTPVVKVYQLKEARTRNIQTVQPLLKRGTSEKKLSEDDDNDSGFSNGNGSICSPNELAVRLATASLKNPAYIKAKIFRNFESSRPGTELSVTQGEIVNLLYKEEDQVLAINSQGKKGFIPCNHCSLLNKKIPYVSQTLTQKSTNQFSREHLDMNSNSLPRHVSHTNSKTRHYMTTRNQSKNVRKEEPNMSSSSSEEERDYYQRNLQYPRENSGYYRERSEYYGKFMWNQKAEDFRQRHKLMNSYFRKGEERRMLVLYDFIARDENDISVYKGEDVAVLNRDDIDWWWVMADDGYEGFVPRAYLGRSNSSVSSEGSTPCSTESFSSSSTTSEGSSTQAVRFQDPLCTFHRYEKEEWETDSEFSENRDPCGYPMENTDAKKIEHESSRCSTWC